MNSSVRSTVRHSGNTLNAVSMRLAWVTYLVAVAAGCVLAFYSVIFTRADFLVGAAIAGVVSWVSRSVLRDGLEAAASDGDLLGEEELFSEENEAVHASRVDGLVNLLREWDRLESARGTAGFDPWALQSVKNELRAAVNDDSVLAKLLCSPVRAG